MIKIDFKKVEDIREFARKYEYYKEEVSLPKDIHQKIEKVQQVLEFQIITLGEAESRIISIINKFMKSLG